MEQTGTVVRGVVVLDPNVSLPEGLRVRVVPLEHTAPGSTVGQRLLKFAGTAKDLPEDMAENHDHYLHGRPRK